MLASIGPSAATLVTRLRRGVRQAYSSSSCPSCQEMDEIIDDLEEVKKTWESIKAVLADAEEVQIRDESVRLWLRDLEDLADRILDLHDLYEYQVMAREVKRHDDSSSGAAAAAASFSSMTTPLHDESCEQPTISIISPLQDPCFRQKIVYDVRKLKREFDGIATRRKNLKLKEAYGPRHHEDTFTYRPETGSLTTDPVFVGRDKEIRELVRLLLADCGEGSNCRSVALLGMGGIGKTTLAQHAYKDPSVAGHFEIKSWIHVSEIFNLIDLTKHVIGSLSGKNPEEVGLLSVLQEKVTELIQGKRILLVLDDVWDDDLFKWETFLTPFVQSAGEGSRILLTSRLPQVASVAGVSTDMQISLKILPEDEGWVALRKNAYGAKNVDVSDEIEEIGRAIVRKCGGSPLAVKVLGRLLRSRGASDESNWRDVLESRLLDEDGQAKNIVGSLYLSYLHLTSKLKTCFKFCGIYSKWKIPDPIGHLKKLLMAYDVVKDEKEADRCLQDLQSRSFVTLSDAAHDEIAMHDLFHDLAEYVLGENHRIRCPHEPDRFRYLPGARHAKLRITNGGKTCECLSIEEGNSRFSFTNGLRAFYLLLSSSSKDFDPAIPDEIFDGLKCVRLLGFFCLRGRDTLPQQLFCLYNLRYLDLSTSNIRRLPESIGNLRKLRGLDLSHSSIEYLPESISLLLQLQELNLLACHEITELPRGIVKLINLMSLTLTGTSVLQLPRGFGNLTKLLYLKEFFCPHSGDYMAAGLGELKDMVNLKGDLAIHNLCNVDSEEDARNTEMAKKRLDELNLDWGLPTYARQAQTNRKDERVINHLKPHRSVKKLSINGYLGSRLPSWMGDQNLTKLVSLKLHFINSCKSLSPVDQLPSLEQLEIYQMFMLSELVPVQSAAAHFPKLEMLTIKHCRSIQSLPLADFASLKEVLVSCCSMLEVVTPPRNEASSLAFIRISDCPRCRLAEDPAQPWSFRVSYSSDSE